MVGAYGSDGSLNARYLTPGLDSNLAETRSGSTYYYMADGLGSVRNVVDASETVQDTYDYYAFGNTLTASPANVTNPYRYTGREYESGSVLDTYYYRNRYYVSQLGIFMSRDAEWADLRRGWTYVRNLPVAFFDPWGFKDQYNSYDAYGKLSAQGYSQRYLFEESGAIDSRNREHPFEVGYVDRSIDQALRGNYSPYEPTVLGTVGQVGAGLLGFDLPADIRDLAYDVQHWSCVGWSQKFFDALGLLPIIGALKPLKYGDEAADALKGGAKALSKADEAGDAAKAAFRSAENSFRYDGKIANQMPLRGWSDAMIDETLSAPAAARAAVNKKTGDAATAFFRADGSYVVRDNATGLIIQISDIGDPGWIPDSSIVNPFAP